MKSVDVLKEAINLMTTALTNHRHNWTIEEGEAYKKAMQILNNDCWEVVKEYIEIFNNLKKEV